MTMAGISSKAAGILGNNKKYNGIEENRDLDLNQYDAFYRNLDPQTGRFWQVDPKLEDGDISITPYASMSNNPILRIDPLGDQDGVGIGIFLPVIQQILTTAGIAVSELSPFAIAVLYLYVYTEIILPKLEILEADLNTSINVWDRTNLNNLWKTQYGDAVSNTNLSKLNFGSLKTVQAKPSVDVKPRSASDQKLIADAKAKKAKEAKTANNSANTQTQTNRGNNRNGNTSLEGDRPGAHRGGKDKATHEKAYRHWKNSTKQQRKPDKG